MTNRFLCDKIIRTTKQNTVLTQREQRKVNNASSGICARGVFCGDCCLRIFYFLEVSAIAAKDTTLINDEIRAQEVRVVDSDGSQLGIMKIGDARKIAYDKGLDLVEIAANAQPPVCRVMDYGKFRFEKEKKEKEAKKKQQKIDVKEIQLSCRIDTHDFETKLNHARKFIASGAKVKVSVKFKGREMSHTAIGHEIITKFGEACTDIGVIEKPAVLDGRQMLMFLGPKSAAQLKKEQKKAKEAAEESAE